MWIKILGNSNYFQVSADECPDVASLIVACQRELPDLLGSYSCAQICLFLSDSAISLKHSSATPIQNSKRTALIIAVNDHAVSSSISPFWLITGIIPNILRREECVAQFYLIAARNLAFYDDEPIFVHGDDGLLKIRILFHSETKALEFDNELQIESVTKNSSFLGIEFNLQLPIPVKPPRLIKRIYAHYYDLHDFSLASDAESGISGATSIATDSVSKYQRLESESCFGTYMRPDSCHMMSKSFCLAPENFDRYGEYDRDENNILALSPVTHQMYDGRTNIDFPLFNLKVMSKSPFPVVEGRYEVKLSVTAFDEEAARMVFRLLKEGSQRKGELEMITSVFVLNPTVFQECLEWKASRTAKIWKMQRIAGFYSKNRILNHK